MSMKKRVGSCPKMIFSSDTEVNDIMTSSWPEVTGEIYSKNELDTIPSNIQQIAPSTGMFQNGKRCGILFISKTYNSYNLLVVRGKTSNIWSIPKGRVSSEDESEELCAIRETFEETGIKIDSVKDFPRITLGKNIYFIYHTNKNKYQNFKIIDEHEVGEVAWKSIYELKSLIINKDLRAIVRYPTRQQSFHRIIFGNNIQNYVDKKYHFSSRSNGNNYWRNYSTNSIV
jgi:8-oxo-dGTP pyrophosphatase MutT (NUDIX family)